ncbi:MAG: hypothetical protein ACFCVD_06495 [Nodosilinea sp.]
MTFQPLATASPATADPLAQAAQLDEPRPDSQIVVATLLEAERLAKSSPQSLSAEALVGTWRLRFTAPKKPAYKEGQPVGRGFYWPGLALATISFGPDPDTADRLTIENQLQVGPLKLRFMGPAKFLPKKHLLAFDFVRLQLWLGGLQVLNLPLKGAAAKQESFLTTPVGQLPFFAFFAATERYIAARGRGGGLALWVKG